ncbi:MAG: rhodanese-like domain-containing protein [Candidatus Bathyarchaeia archaeon]
MKKKNTIVCLMLISLLVSTFLLIQPAVAEEPEYQNVSVQEANQMISQNPSLVILDVRNESEYKMGYLFGAILIPLNELEGRIGELPANQNDTILVYCGVGGRSAQASQILTGHDFTNVYNMEGGITAWIQADYPIITSYHHVSVGVGENETTTLEIVPLLGLDCGCFTGVQECTDTSGVIDTNKTVIDQGEDYTVTLITYTFNGSTLELIQNKTLLWSYADSTSTENTTAQFIQTELTVDGLTSRFYVLNYLVQHPDYNVSLHSSLVPLNENTYNNSLTIVNYAPAGGSDVLSLEMVEFDSPVTLSTLYATLAQVANEMADIYQQSEDETIVPLADRYFAMGQKIGALSDIVSQNLPDYDKPILYNMAFLVDDWLSCLACVGPIVALCYLGCAGLCVAFPPVCPWLWACADLGCNTAVTLYCESVGWCP